jgi:hypothetical protein
MRRLPYLIAAAAISGLALSAAPTSASPLASGLTDGNATMPEMNEGLVQKVHGWHCRAKKGWYRGDRYWHRHRRACRDYSYRYRPYRYGFGAPFVGFSFGFGDRNRHHRRHWDWD